MFAFNFSATSSDESAADGLCASDPAPSASSDTPSKPPAREHPPSEARAEADEWAVEDVAVEVGSSRYVLRKPVQPERLLQTLVSGDAAASTTDDLNSSDLVSGVYEGGFKLWECARDVMEVMEQRRLEGKLVLRGARVLEAGCGAGLPGALALRLGCAEVVLQDYNASVLRWMTMPMLRLNGLWESALRGDARFLSGDWAELAPLLDSRSAAADGKGADGDADDGGRRSGGSGFDLIITTETIYNSEATPRLWQLIKQQLRRPSGVCLVAAKSYYFGVGGSVAEFCALVRADGRFECETLRTFEDGASNRREVLQVTWRDGAATAAEQEEEEEEASAPTDSSEGARGETADEVSQQQPPSKRARPNDSSSSPLEQLLGDGTTVAHFFDAVWEQAPLRCSGAHTRLPGWGALPSWESLLGVLDVARRSPQSDVLCLKDQHPTTAYASAAAAFLDGASLIVNHAEAASGGVGSLCRALRECGDFPHAFGNLYVTPPLGRAVDAHADDRDVLVLQLEGRKAWKVYGPPPVPHPAPDEQVGKSGVPVPAAAVAAERALLDVTLARGDVLYIPRGFVHEACTGADAASLHLTVALPSHDWSWAALAAAAATAGRVPARSDGASLSRELRAREVCEVDLDGGEEEAPMRWLWRRAVPPPLAGGGAARSRAPGSVARGRRVGAALAAELKLASAGGDDAEPMLLAMLHERSAVHGARQDAGIREGDRLAEACAAAAMVSPSSLVRRRRDDEPKAAAAAATGGDEDGGGGGGLLAREEFADALFATLARLTTAPCRVASFDDAPLLDDFGKACFASVCVGLGLLVVDDAGVS